MHVFKQNKYFANSNNRPMKHEYAGRQGLRHGNTPRTSELGKIEIGKGLFLSHIVLG